jgi:hypothetical protein
MYITACLLCFGSAQHAVYERWLSGVEALALISNIVTV